MSFSFLFIHNVINSFLINFVVQSGTFNMKYPIIVILIGFIFFTGSFFIDNYGNQLHEDAVWGKIPEENIEKAEKITTAAKYIKQTGNYVAIGGEVWLLIILIGKISPTKNSSK